MNYYIQGSKQNAEQIKAAFEKLGIDVLDFGFADKTVVYCSIGGCGGCVQSLPYSINLMHILYSHPDYKELELAVKPTFKVGDSLQSGSHFTKILSINLEEGRYYCDNRIISFENQDLWHLVPKPHYDITTSFEKNYKKPKPEDDMDLGSGAYGKIDF